MRVLVLLRLFPCQLQKVTYQSLSAGVAAAALAQYNATITPTLAQVMAAAPQGGQEWINSQGPRKDQ